MVLNMAGKTDPDLFRAGAGQVVITPPVGFVIDGPEHGARESTGVADDLMARAVVLESKGTRVVLVSLDVWGITADLRDSIIDCVSQAAEVASKFVWITVTGNGNSPPLWRVDPQYVEYVAELPEKIAGAVHLALAAMEPASMGSTGTVLSDISTFVDEPGRPGNPALFVLAINRADGSGIARLVNFACPATVLGCGQASAWTADYPGVASSTMQQNGAGLTLFSQAPSHDIRPFDWWTGNEKRAHSERVLEDVQFIGHTLAAKTQEAASEITQRRNVVIEVRQDSVAGITVMRIGDAFFVSTDKPQPNKFARRLRRDLPHSNTFVSANLSGGMFDAKATFDARGVRRGMAILHELGAT